MSPKLAGVLILIPLVVWSLFGFDFFRTHEELGKHISHHSSEVSNDSELITEQCADLNEAKTPTDTAHLQEEKREEHSMQTESRGERQEGSQKEDEKENKEEERKVTEEQNPTRQNGEDVVHGQERAQESRNEDVKLREDVEDGVDEKVRIQEDLKERKERENEEVPGVERSIQVLDGHIALGSVQWKECRAVGRIQV